MIPEKRRLIEELLDEEQGARREKILAAGGQILRRRRWRRSALRSCAVATLVGLCALFIRRSPPHVETVAVHKAAPAQPKSLTDEELLGLFPDTPVALATLDNGKKRLIFPHAGDEQRFITKL